ncbi:MAG: alanine:cation symporter family protein, partial [Cyanobacteria bacterium P01_A01_bin.3]
VFGFADVTMGLLALVNLAALMMLFKVGLRVMWDFEQQLQAGIAEPVFDRQKFSRLNLDGQAWDSGDAEFPPDMVPMPQ